MDKLWNKAKQFIGLEEEGGDTGENEQAKEGEKNVIRFRAARKQTESTGGPEVAVFEPRVYEDSLGVSLRLRQGNPVIINLKYLDPDEGTRLIDFVCGAAYAIDGHMMRIGESIFLFTPNSIAIVSEEEKSKAEHAFQGVGEE